MTDAERKLWHLLRDPRLGGVKFRRQVPIGPYIADFLAYEQRLVVEVDGSQHVDSALDRRRDSWCAANGYRVLRFWNNDVHGNPEGTFEAIRHALESGRAAPPHPGASRHLSPARGEGSGVRGDPPSSIDVGEPAASSKKGTGYKARPRAAVADGVDEAQAVAAGEPSPLAGEGGPRLGRGPDEGAKPGGTGRAGR